VLVQRLVDQNSLVTFQVLAPQLSQCGEDMEPSLVREESGYQSVIHSHSQELIIRELGLTLAQNRTKDVCLHSGGRYVTCHRWLLSAGSPWLRQLMYDVDPYQSKDKIDLCFPDFSYKELCALVNFLYKGQVTIKRKGGAKIRSLLWLLQMELSIDIERQVGESSDKENSDFIENTYNDQTKISRLDVVTNSQTIDMLPQESPAVQKRHVNVNRKTFYIGKGTKASHVSSKGVNTICVYCSKHFKSNYSLKKHMKMHDEPEGLKCSYCQKAFACKETLVSHIRTHTGELFICEFSGCNKKFNNMRSLKDHENVHSGKESFLCHFCGENFATKKKLFNHKEKHKTISDPCNLCGKELKNMASYKAHMKAHNQGKSFACNICGRAFKRKFDLTVHTRIHTGDKPYTCNVCGKSFSLTSTLSKHKKFHVNTSSVGAVFACSVCETKFGTAAELTVHRRDSHQSEFLIVDEDGNLLSGVQDNTHQVTICSGISSTDPMDVPAEADRVHEGQLVTLSIDGRIVSDKDRVQLRVPSNI